MTVSISPEFSLALSMKKTLERRADEASSELNKLRAGAELGPMGLTPDHIKQSPEWRTATIKFLGYRGALQKYNQAFLRVHKKQYRQYISENRGAA